MLLKQACGGSMPVETECSTEIHNFINEMTQ